jgi:hypothetical protein
MTKIAVFTFLLLVLSGCVIPFAFPVGPADDQRSPNGSNGDPS